MFLPPSGVWRPTLFDKIIVFGDSYNDVGNLTALAAKYGFVYPPPPYYPGHFSNGPIWIEDVASDWKLPMLPSSAGGTDYAFAGADLLMESTTGGCRLRAFSMK